MKYSFPDSTDSFSEKNNFSKIITIIIIVILILLGLFLATAYFINKNSNLNQNKNTNGQARTMSVSMPQEPAIIYKRSGQITDIQIEFFVIQTKVRTDSYDPALAYEMRNLSVYFDENTVFTKKNFSDFNQTQIIPESKSSSKKELHIGDTINVTASVNIKDLTSFTATEIELIY